jgi:hypothetical protein
MLKSDIFKVDELMIKYSQNNYSEEILFSDVTDWIAIK